MNLGTTEVLWCLSILKGLLSHSKADFMFTWLCRLLFEHLLFLQLISKQTIWLWASSLDGKAHLMCQRGKFGKAGDTVPQVKHGYCPQIKKGGSCTPFAHMTRLNIRSIWYFRDTYLLTWLQVLGLGPGPGTTGINRVEKVRLYVVQCFCFTCHLHWNILANFCCLLLFLLMLIDQCFLLQILCIFSLIVLIFQPVNKFLFLLLFTCLVSVHLTGSGLPHCPNCLCSATAWF